jgi:hypothetical protein
LANSFRRARPVYLVAIRKPVRYKLCVAILEGISAAKAALDVSKAVLDLTRYPKLDTTAIQAKLLEMQGLILSAQQALGDAQEANRQLRRELEEVRDQRKIAESLVFADGIYWIRKPDATLDGLYCPTCWDDQGKLIRLKFEHEGQLGQDEQDYRLYMCVLHKITYLVRSAVFKPADLIR